MMLLTWYPFEVIASIMAGAASSPSSALILYTESTRLTSFTDFDCMMRGVRSSAAPRTPSSTMSPPRLAFSSAGDPILTSLPWSIIAILSQTPSASSR